MEKNQTAMRIPFTGAIDREGPSLSPHSMAFPAAMMSLKVLMGLPHETHTIFAHNMQWRADHDDNLYLCLSGEGFRFLFDTAEYFRFQLPEGAEPVRACFAYTGIPVSILSKNAVSGGDGTWETEEELKELVLNTLRAGFPCLLLSRTTMDRVLLAIGYEDAGETLVAWTFVPGGDMTNKSFSPEDCQYIANWWQGTDAALLVLRSPESPQGQDAILRAALERGVRDLRAHESAPYGTQIKYYDKWIATLRDEDFWHTVTDGLPMIDPEIWDLAERRAYSAGFLEQVQALWKTDALQPGIDALNKIHGEMWRIHALIEGEDSLKKLKDPSIRAQIAEIIEGCRMLDETTADALCAYLDR